MTGLCVSVGICVFPLSLHYNVESRRINHSRPIGKVDEQKNEHVYPPKAEWYAWVVVNNRQSPRRFYALHIILLIFSVLFLMHDKSPVRWGTRRWLFSCENGLQQRPLRLYRRGRTATWSSEQQLLMPFVSLVGFSSFNRMRLASKSSVLRYWSLHLEGFLNSDNRVENNGSRMTSFRCYLLICKYVLY